MPFITRFTDRTPLISPHDALSVVAEQFSAFPAAQAFAVAADGRIAGLIERAAVHRAIRDGQAGSPVERLMIDTPLTLDAKLTAREALALLLANPGRPDCFVVLKDGEYAGVGALRGLAQGLLAAEASRPAEAAPAAAQAVDLQRLLRSAETELRAQVQGLLAMADRLERQHLHPDAQAQVQSIKAVGESLLRLADGARDMVEAREGRLELQLRPQPLRALMDQVQGRWSARAVDAGVTLLMSYDGDPDLSAVVDGERLAQVFDSLIENALRHTRQGSVEASLRARADGEQVLLEGRVRDTGPDRAAAGLDPLSAADGGALSLPLAQGIVRSMRGEIHAESNAGQGMTIVFSFAAETASEAPAPIQGRPVTGAPHVLVVDDNATNRMVAEALCEMFDCTSETAEDGLEAIEAARTGRFDLILMDIKMPRMDGIAATKAIRALEGPVGTVPVVALTANVDPEDARSYLAAGMCCVVEKPIKPDRLLQAIHIAMTSAAAAEGDHRVAAA